MKRFRIVLALCLCAMSLLSWAKTWKNPNIQKVENLQEYEMKRSKHRVSYSTIKVSLPPFRLKELQVQTGIEAKIYSKASVYQLQKDTNNYVCLYYREAPSSTKAELLENYTSEISYEKVNNVYEVVLMPFSLKGSAINLKNKNKCKKKKIVKYYHYETNMGKTASFPIELSDKKNGEFQISVALNKNHSQPSEPYFHINLSVLNQEYAWIKLNHKPYLFSLIDRNHNGYYDQEDEYEISSHRVHDTIITSPLDRSFSIGEKEYSIAKIKTFFSDTTMYLYEEALKKDFTPYSMTIRTLPLPGKPFPSIKKGALNIFVDIPLEPGEPESMKEYMFLFGQLQKSIEKTGIKAHYQVFVPNNKNLFIYNELQPYLPQDNSCDILLKYSLYGRNNNYEKMFPKSKRFDDANLFGPKKIRIKVYDEHKQQIQCKEFVGQSKDFKKVLNALLRPITGKTLTIEPAIFNSLSKEANEFPYLKRGAITVLMDAHSGTGLLREYAHMIRAIETLYPKQEFKWQLIGNYDLASMLVPSRHLFSHPENIHAVILPFDTESSRHYRNHFSYISRTTHDQNPSVAFYNDQGERIYYNRNFQIENRLELEKSLPKKPPLALKKEKESISFPEPESNLVPDYLISTSMHAKYHTFIMSYKDNKYIHRTFPFEEEDQSITRIIAHPEKQLVYCCTHKLGAFKDRYTLYEYDPQKMTIRNRWTTHFYIRDFDPETGTILGHKKKSKLSPGAIYLKRIEGDTATIKIKIPMEGTMYPVLIKGEDSLVTMGKKDGQIDLWRVDNIFKKAPKWTQLTDTIEKEETSTVSPDGTKLVFQRADPDGYNLYLYEFKNKKCKKITENTGLDCMASFCPDSESIVYIQRRANHSIKLPVEMNLNTGEITEIVCDDSFRNYSYPIALKKTEK